MLDNLCSEYLSKPLGMSKAESSFLLPRGKFSSKKAGYRATTSAYDTLLQGILILCEEPYHSSSATGHESASHRNA